MKGDSKRKEGSQREEYSNYNGTGKVRPVREAVRRAADEGRQ
jgi:hypothetical protein